MAFFTHFYKGLSRFQNGLLFLATFSGNVLSAGQLFSGSRTLLFPILSIFRAELPQLAVLMGQFANGEVLMVNTASATSACNRHGRHWTAMQTAQHNVDCIAWRHTVRRLAKLSNGIWICMYPAVRSTISSLHVHCTFYGLHVRVSISHTASQLQCSFSMAALCNRLLH